MITPSLDGRNVFYTPWFLEAAALLGGPAPDIKAAPALPSAPASFPFAAMRQALWGPYSPLSSPRTGDAGSLAGELANGGRRYLHLPMLALDGHGMALLAALEERGARARILSRHERACLSTSLGAEDYLRQAMSQKRRKRAREARNRLGREGDVRFITAGDAASRTALLADYLSLEASGWKGRKGSAMAGDERTRSFLERLVSAGGPEGLSLHALHVGDKPVAAGIVLHDGPVAWYWKTAYLESLSHASPGVVFTLALTKHLRDERGIAMIDSCAVPDHPMINGIWSERLPIANVLIDFSPGLPALLPSALAASLEGRSAAKRLLSRLRG